MIFILNGQKIQTNCCLWRKTEHGRPSAVSLAGQPRRRGSDAAVTRCPPVHSGLPASVLSRYRK